MSENTGSNNKQKETYKTHGSLKRIFLSVIILTYIITAAATLTVFYFSAGRIGNEYAGRFALSRNMLEKNRLLSLVEGELVLSRKLADDPVIVNWVANENDPQANAAAEAQLASYKKFLQSNTLFVAILQSGSYYFNTIDQATNTLSPANPYDKWFYEAISENKDYSLNVDYNSSLDQVKVWFNIIVRNKQGEPIGIAGSGMDIGSFLQNLMIHKQEGLSSIIINARGQLQAHRDKSIIEFNAKIRDESQKKTIYDLIESKSDRLKVKDAINKAISTGEIQKLRINIEGCDMIAALGGIPELGWFNIVLVDGSSIIGVENFMPLGAVFLLSLLAVMAVTAFILNKLVLNPLSRLSDAATNVASGAYEITLPENSKNEIGLLSSSFNSMTRKIKAYTSNLENMVAKRTEALNTANRELLESQQRVTDSIRYAKLIQNSILPAHSELEEHLSESFSIFKPLDIVGGDFYYFQQTEEGFCIAVVDCTGHGVPGAFMTMMSAALLNRVIETDPGAGPDKMLENLHYLVQETLKSESEFAHLENGLDIALCKVNRRENVLEFSGAGLGLFICEGENVREITGQRLHLGFSNTRREYKFECQKVELKDDNRYYMVSDGVLDLPGGENGFGLGRKRLKKIIAEIQGVSLREQEKKLMKILENYRGNYLQRDDMVMIGFKVKRENRNA